MSDLSDFSRFELEESHEDLTMFAFEFAKGMNEAQAKLKQLTEALRPAIEAAKERDMLRSKKAHYYIDYITQEILMPNDRALLQAAEVLEGGIDD